jgi:hypothetical protein
MEMPIMLSAAATKATTIDRDVTTLNVFIKIILKYKIIKRTLNYKANSGYFLLAAFLNC